MISLKAIICAVAVALLLFGATPDSYGYKLLVHKTGTYTIGEESYPNLEAKDTSDDGPFLHWPSPSISWYLNSTSCSDVSNKTSLYNAVNDAFEEWEDASTDDHIAFTGNTDNSISQDPSDAKNALFWTTDLIAADAQALITYNTTTGEISDVDIVFSEDSNIWTLDTENLTEILHIMGSIYY